MIAFGFVHALGLALAGLAVAGGMDSISGLFRHTMWNEIVPTHLRGRLAGIEMLSWASGPTLGGAEAGAVAALAGVRASVSLRGRAVRRRDGRARAAAAALRRLRRAHARDRAAAARARAGARAAVIRSVRRCEQCSTSFTAQGCARTVTNGTGAQPGSASTAPR
jgi:hypothetical protein